MTHQPESPQSDAELLQDYWAAQAQFGPFDVGPDQYLKRCREQGE